MSWGTIARGVISRTVKDLTAVPGAERVGIRCKRVAPFRAQFIVRVVRVRRERIAKEERRIQRLCLGDFDGRARCSEFLGESSPLRNGGERAGGAAVVRERLHIHGGGTVVVHDGILG